MEFPYLSILDYVQSYVHYKSAEVHNASLVATYLLHNIILMVKLI